MVYCLICFCPVSLFLMTHRDTCLLNTHELLLEFLESDTLSSMDVARKN
jgi:hypothetical protein